MQSSSRGGELVPMLGVPVVLLSNQGTHLLHPMQDVCKLLESRNSTLWHTIHVMDSGTVQKTMLWKHVSKFGMQWDLFLSGVILAYHNTSHLSTGEKPSFLLYGFEC